MSISDVVRQGLAQRKTNKTTQATNYFSESNITQLSKDIESLNTWKSQEELAELRKKFSTIERDLFRYGDGSERTTTLLESVRGANDHLNRVSDIYSRYSSADEYNKYSSSGWLDQKADTNIDTVSLRKEQYQNNTSRIEDIEEELPWYANTWLPNFVEDIFLSKDKEALRDEAERRKAENLQYDRTQGVTDKYYTPITEEFKQNASFRDYSNASREELDAYDASASEGSLALSNGGYFDEEGNIVNSKGEVVQYANAPEVQDKLGMFFSAVEDGTYLQYVNELSDNGALSNIWGELMQEGDTGSWRYLTEHEIDIYYDLYKREGQESAYKFLEDMTTELNRRETQAQTDYINESDGLKQILLNLASIPMNVFGGATSFIDDASNIIKGEDIDPYSRAHMFQNAASDIRNKTATDIDNATGNVAIPWIDFSVGDAYQALMSGADSLVGSAIGGTGYGILMGMGSASSTAKDLYEKGASNGQIVFGSLLAGAAEMVFEKYSIDEFVKMKDAKTAKAIIVNILKQGGVEASEEMLTEISNTIANVAVMGSQSDWVDMETFVQNVVNAGVGGFVSGGGMGGVGSMASYNQYNKQTKAHGRDIIEQGGIDTLKKLALEMSGVKQDSEGQEIANLVGKVAQKASAKNVGRLSSYMGDIVTAQNRSDIQQALVKKGLSEKDAKRVSEYLANSNSLTEAQRAEIEGNENIKAVVDELINNPNSSISERARSLIFARLGISPSSASQASPQQEETASVTENATAEEIASTGKFEASEDGRTILSSTGDEISIKEIAYINGEEITLRLDNGNTVNASEVSFGTEEEGLLYENVVDMGLNAVTANAFIKGYDPSEGLSVKEYIIGFREAYRYGEYNFPAQEMSQDGFPAKLSQSQKDLAYGLGKTDGKYKTETKQKAVAKNATTTKADEESPATRSKTEQVRKGKVHYDGETLGKSLTKRQKASLKGLEVLADALGVDFHIFESAIDENGKRKGANGWFDPKNGSMHIDLYAGLNGEGTILFTAAHELTHFIREWSPAKFKIFADFLMEQYGKKGVSVDALVKAQIEKAKRNGRSISYDTAYEEVIADSCEAMLSDGDVIQKIAELKAKDESLWQKIKDFITELVAKIKKVYRGLSPDSVEGRYVAEMLDTAEKLKALWMEALVEASDAYAESDLVEVDSDTESVAPNMFSERTWTESEYVIHKDQMAKKIATALGVSIKKAKSYIDDINSIAKMIADDRARLDYEASSFGSAFVSNVEYGGSFDYTTLCKKRRIYTGTFTEIQKRLKDVALTPDDILAIRNLMIEEGIEATCGLCYVEGSRANMGKFAKEFIRLYKRDNPLAWIPNMADVNTPDGVEQMRISHPEAYEQYVYFWNHYGKLKDSDPALFASQQKPKLYEARKEYKGEILEHFEDVSTVAKKNRNGGIRMQSFSDFEIVHLIDTMQVIMDMSTVGLAGQAYTKVPEFAKAFGNTGLKINLSLIAKGVDADGNLIFDDREGMPHDTAFDLRDRYSKNVGTIIVTFTDEQLLASMADPRIDFIIPFHRSQWKKGQYGAMGLPKGTKDYTYMQNEKLIKKTYHEYRGRMVLDKASNYMPNEYWDFSKSGKENAESYLKMCAENNKRPKFYKLLDYDGKGTYSLKADGSTDGYWKLLIDFKMYDNDGNASPQNAVTPTFNMDEAKTMLDEYRGGHSKYPVANSVVDTFVEKYNKENGTKYSDRDSMGNELSKEQIEFFKDSKVRNNKGNLIVLYHGTTANFNTFKKGDIGFHFGTKGAARGRVGFGKNVIIKEVYLNITNPIVFDEDLGSWDADYRLTRELYDRGILTQAEAESVLFSDDRRYRRSTEAANKKLASVLLEKGYDGIAYQNTFETKKPTTSYIVFNSNQVKEITNKTPTSNSDIRYSDRSSYAPTFYSYMGKVIDDIRLDKMGAGGVVSYLKGKGVKNDEIKWSGIEAWLEGKKSVTKKELQEFVAGSQLQIVEQISGEDIDLRYDGSNRAYNLYDSNGKVIDTFTYNEFLDGYVAESDEEIYSNEIELKEALREEYGNTSAPKWAQYKLDGGENYRELVFQMPNSSYTNRAMRVHWGQDVEGVLAHARIQDFNVNGKKMLFIEELQSDWHNEGHAKGYTTPEYEDAVAVYDKLAEDYANKRRAFNKYVRSGEFRSDPDEVSKKKFDWLRRKMDEAEKRMQDAERDVEALKAKGMGNVPDAPFKDTYHEYVLKRLLRMAAEEGYDSLGWTPADIQSERWSDEFAEGYRIEYDQDIPKFLKKYGKKWGATVGTARTTEGYDVWSMDIPDSMTESVLYEGQVMYSDRVTDKKTLDFLENQEHITTYKSFVEIDGKLYSPMATKVKDDDGKYRLTNPSELGVWQQAEEKPDSIPKFHKSGYGYYVLKKDDGGSVTAAYNPYEHSSNLVLNDQFESAYQRPNLVTVECIIPKSEMTSGYKAKYAKDSTGYLDWKSGTVAGKLKGNKRKVYLSRWLKPVRIVSDAEVASMYKDILGANISVPFNVVTPQLLAELEKVGVKIDYEGSPGYQYRQSQKKTDDGTKFSDRDTDSVSNRSLLANALESVAQNDIERNRLNEYKKKIALIEAEQKKLAEIRAKIKELSFARGARDTVRINNLQDSATRIANRINTYDRQLLDLEASKPLKAVLMREKQMAYKRAEQRGKEAVAKQREKDAETIRRLMTRYQESRQKGVEGRKRTALRHKIRDVVSDLNQLLLNPTKEKHVPIGLQRAVSEALDIINMDTVGADERIAKIDEQLSKTSDPDKIKELVRKRDRIELQGANLSDRLTALKNAYAEIKNSDDPLVKNAHDEAIENLIENTANIVGNTALRDMSFEQLEAVYNMYKAIRATVRNANKMFKQGRQTTVSENSETVKTEVREVGGHKDRVLKITKFLKKQGWNMLKPITAMKVVGSNTFAELFNNVRAGEDTWAVDVNEAKAFFGDMKSKYGYKKWDFKKRYSFEDSIGNKFSLSLEQIMSLYAYSKRDQADRHLEVGGFIFDDTIEVTEKNKLGIPLKYEVNDANPYQLAKEDLGAVINSLTEEQKGFVDEMQTYLSDVMGAKGNEVSLELYDIKLYNEKNYFPLKTSRYFREFDPEKSGTPKIKNSGFSKNTVPHAGNPIVLSNFTDVWSNHVNDMSMYHAFVLPLEDFMRVYNYSSTAGGYDSVQQYIKNAYGAQANEYIERLMDDLNSGARVDPSAGIINKGLSLFKKSSVFASASVVVQQPSAIARAFAYIDPKYFAKATPSALNLARHKALWAEVKKYAPVAVIKEMGYFDTGMGRSTVEWLKDENTIMSKIDNVLSKAPGIADELVWSHIWEAVKKETLATTDLKSGSEEFFKKCGKRFTEVIVNTQVYDSVLSRSGMMRSKDTGMKMATAFMAEPTTTVNMMVDGIIQAKRGNKKFLRNTVGAISASIILNSMLVAIVYAARDDDEDETYAEKYVGSLTSELIDGFNPITYIPFAKDAWSIAQGYDVERSDMSVISNLWESVEGLFNKDKSGWEKVSDTVSSVSSVFGLPMKNILRDAKGVYNFFETITSGTPTTGAGIAEAMEESARSSVPLVDRLTESKTNADRLYDAIVSGDQTQIDRVKSRFKDENAVTSAIRQGLRNNDPRIKQAAEARYNGDIAEYMRIAKEIIAEGYFSQDNIVAAINAEISAMKKDEETTASSSSNKATSIFKAEDYYAALANRDEATAYTVKEDIINTAVANGKDRDEAESSFNSSLANHIGDEFVEGNLSGDEAYAMLINYAGRTEKEAYSKVMYWTFKQEYPDYDLNESAVTKYYEYSEPYGIDIGVYYDYTVSRAKCEGRDSNGDGRADSGTVKAEVMWVINSLPLTSAQKDALYFANGWSRSTLHEAPWH